MVGKSIGQRSRLPVGIRDDHVYRARRGEGATQRQLIRDLLGRAFGGSAKALVVQALSARPVPAEELAEIRRLLDNLEGKIS